MNPKKRGPKQRKQLVALVSLYLAALLLTCGLFFAYRVYVHHKTFASRSFFWIGDVHTHDEGIGFRMAPRRQGFAVLNGGVEDSSRRIPVRTDQFGFRIPMQRDSTSVEAGGLIGIGCSCTFGHGVAAESTYVELAGEMLQLPAYNLGVCSYSTVTSIELLRRHVEILRPEFIVYGFGNFHLARSVRQRTDGVLFQAYLHRELNSHRVVPPRFSNELNFEVSPRIEDAYYKKKLRGESLRFNLARLRAVAPLAIQDLKRAVHPQYLKLRFESNEISEAAYLRWMVTTLLEVSRQHAARVVLLYFPADFGEKPLPELDAALQELDEGDEIIFVDASKRLFAGVSSAQEYRRRFQVSRDGHPNSLMHLEMARAIREEIARRNLLPDSRRSHPR